MKEGDGCYVHAKVYRIEESEDIALIEIENVMGTDGTWGPLTLTIKVRELEEE